MKLEKTEFSNLRFATVEEFVDWYNDLDEETSEQVVNYITPVNLDWIYVESMIGVPDPDPDDQWGVAWDHKHIARWNLDNPDGPPIEIIDRYPITHFSTVKKLADWYNDLDSETREEFRDDLCPVNLHGQIYVGSMIAVPNPDPDDKRVIAWDREHIARWDDDPNGLPIELIKR
jgi:hypothetical protein